MNKWIKRSAIALGGIVALAAVAVVGGTTMADRKMNRQLAVPVQPVAFRSDDQSVTRGSYLFASRGCADCHGANAAGKVFVDDPNGLFVRGPNITSGAGGVVAAYKPEDWVRTIRHGVGLSGKPLLIMPSEDYNRFTDDDLASLVAYLRQVPPVTGEPAAVRLPAIVKVMYAVGVVQDAYEKIDHSLPPAKPVAEGVNTTHGAYVANMCQGCHGVRLSGGKIPGGPPDWPAAANLTPGEGSAMPRYASAEQFRQMLRSGKRPDGVAIKVMPFNSLKEINDTDADALYLYLKGLAPVAANNH